MIKARRAEGVIISEILLVGIAVSLSAGVFYIFTDETISGDFGSAIGIFEATSEELSIIDLVQDCPSNDSSVTIVNTGAHETSLKAIAINDVSNEATVNASYRSSADSIALATGATSDPLSKAQCNDATYLSISSAWGAPGNVEFDASTSAQKTSGESLSWSHTTSGNDRLLIVYTVTRKNQANDGVTYAGSNLTFLDTINKNSDVRVEAWYKVNPAVGSNTVYIDADDAEESLVAAAISFKNVDQTTPLGTHAKTRDQTPTPSATVSSAVGGMVVDGVGVATDAATLTAGGGQTERWYELVTGVPSDQEITAEGSTEPGSGGAIPMSWTLSSQKAWAMIAIPINPGPAEGVQAVFTGTADPQVSLPSSLKLNFDSTYTAAGVNVIVQAYNYTLGGYSTSTDGMKSFIFATPDSDNMVSMDLDPAHYLDASDQWRFRVIAHHDNPFTMNLDLVRVNAVESEAPLHEIMQLESQGLVLYPGDTMIVNATLSRPLDPYQPYKVTLVTERSDYSEVFAGSAAEVPPNFLSLACTPSDHNQSLQDAIDAIEVLKASYSGTVLDKLNAAQVLLQTAQTEVTKNPPDNQAAAGAIEGAEGELEAAVTAGLDPTDGDQIMTQVANIGRNLASCAIQDAIDRVGNQSSIDLAKQYVNDGDALKAAGQYKDAAAKYKDAVAAAEGA